MQIISAARRTGKSLYTKLLADSTGATVVAPSVKLGKGIYKRYIDPSYLLDALEKDYRIDWDNHPLELEYIFEEPALYQGQFIKLLNKIPEKQIVLIIGTPLSENNLFSIWLNNTTKPVTRWVWEKIDDVQHIKR